MQHDLTFADIQCKAIIFAVDGETIIKLTTDGFHYKDEFIQDAGKAYGLMVKFLESRP